MNLDRPASADLQSAADLQVESLTPDRRDELMTFLGGDGFVDNPDWSDCYCQWPFEDSGKSEEGSDADGDESIPEGFDVGAYNRRLACSRIDARIMRGHLALREDRIVGWCAAGPRERYSVLGDILGDGADSVGAIMCFVVEPASRGKGVGTALLNAALDEFRAGGLAYAEAYPRRDASSEAAKFHGSVGMYLAAGFTVHDERDDGTTVVRLQLASR